MIWCGGGGGDSSRKKKIIAGSSPWIIWQGGVRNTEGNGARRKKISQNLKRNRHNTQMISRETGPNRGQIRESWEAAGACSRG